MSWKYPSLAAALVYCIGLLMTVSTPLQADDFCSLVPTCANGKALTLIDSEERLDCAMFKCLDEASLPASSTVVTSDKQLRTILETDPSVACPTGEVRVRMYVNGTTTWTCLLSSRYSALKDANVVKDAVFPPKTTDVSEGVLTDVEYCSNGMIRAKVKVTGERHSYLANVTQMRCLTPSIYQSMKRRGLILPN